MVETVDVRFDETNGSQREHLPNVLYELSPSELIKEMGTGKIIPSENQTEEERSFLHLINLNTMPSLKTILLTMTMISKSKIFVLLIHVLQMKYILRR